MLYFIQRGHELLSVHESFEEIRHLMDRVDNEFKLVSRHDLKAYADAQALALKATKLTGEDYLPCDQGSHVSPRFDVIKAPKVGDPVSRSFNGDSYPAGRISTISNSWRRIQTDDGTVFWRVRASGSWRAEETWFMVHGHEERRNPSL